MNLDFIADVHISPLTISQLIKSGFRIHRITDFLPATAPDEQILEFAKRQNSVIITQDLDFSALIAQSGQTKPSVISLRVGNAKPDIIAQLLRTVIPQIENELKYGAIISVTEDNYRIRKLPVKTE